jgi:hypothetical protein
MPEKSQVSGRFLIALLVVLSGLPFGGATPGAGSAAVASTIPFCSSSQLNAIGGRQGEATTAAGVLVFVNISSKSCTLSGPPRLLLMKPSGLALSPISCQRSCNVTRVRTCVKCFVQVDTSTA